jgi:antitoxin component of MazEF toxin-antitoxin module
MKTHLRQLGYFKAVLLPTAMLSASGLGDEIEMTVEGRINLTAAKKCRECWYENYLPVEQSEEAALFSATNHDSAEWEW